MLPLSTILIFDFRIVPTVWYFRIVPTVWYFTIVPTVWYYTIVPTLRIHYLLILSFFNNDLQIIDAPVAQSAAPDFIE
jgi:hypothetical protein